MSRAIAINVGANTNLPGFRGPIYPDGRFDYVPIPERKPTAERVPTYADLADEFSFDLPADVAELPTHLDPAFAGYAGRERHTYGDEHGVKAGPLSKLERGDSLFFYATLTRRPFPDGTGDSGDGGRTRDGEAVEWVAPDWGVYLIGEFRVERALTGEAFRALPAEERAPFRENAHLRRDPPDPEVLVLGGEGSRLFDRAVPLSAPDAGATANRLVTELSNDSGKGPWWRRRFWYDEAATVELRRAVDAADPLSLTEN